MCCPFFQVERPPLPLSYVLDVTPRNFHHDHLAGTGSDHAGDWHVVGPWPARARGAVANGGTWTRGEFNRLAAGDLAVVGWPVSGLDLASHEGSRCRAAAFADGDSRQ